MVEIGSIIVLGILAQWIAWRLKVPAILPLILIGLLVGPFAYMQYGYKLIEPMWIEQSHRGLFPGETLFHFVELAIGIILFEGGMTLKRQEIAGVGDSIVKLISVGAVVTFFAAGLAARFIMQLPWNISFLFAALIIVTGPTVIGPILRNLPLKKSVSTVLKWEGILIDPVGALAAVLVYEFIVTSGGAGEFTADALKSFIIIILVGASLGVSAALGLRFLLKKDWVPHYLLTVFTLAFVLFLFVGSNMLVHDSGLLTVVVAGVVLGNIDVPHIKEIEYFKESLVVLLISILFILIAANIDIEDLKFLIKDWRPITLLATVILVVRPLSVFISTMNSTLTLKEKLFISWVGPRGIVAAGIASLLSMKLLKGGGTGHGHGDHGVHGAQVVAETITYPGAELITPLVFMIVLGTVLLNATTAGLVAKWLGVILEKSNGVLIIGAHKFARLLGKYLSDNNKHVVLIDNNRGNIKIAKDMGVKAYQSNIYNDDLESNIELADMGYMMALTSNTEVNNFALGKFGKKFGENGQYRLISAREMKKLDPVPNNGLFSPNDDYINLSEIARDFPHFHEIEVNSMDELDSTINDINRIGSSVPVLLKDPNGSMNFLKSDKSVDTFKEGSKLVYFGKELDKKVKVTEPEEV